MQNEITFRTDVTVELINSMASDSAVAMAARVSTGGTASADADKDAGLINYLMRDRHGSPFEHNAFTFYIEAPIFVFREFMRHRIASYNEESGRYKQLEPVFYIPASDRNLVQIGKPGAYEFVAGDEKMSATTQSALAKTSADAYEKYLVMIDNGVAREVARMVLPVNIYSSMYVTMNARSLMNFLSLRTIHTDSKVPSFPQREIEMVAEKMEVFFQEKMPVTYDTFNKNGRVAP
jgi:thymidylate synthase (FAD)